MRMIRKIKKIGNSFWILVPSTVVESLKLQEDDELVVIMERDTGDVVSYWCRKCFHRFDSDDINPYCPACFCTDLKEVDGYVTELKGGEEE